MDSLKATITMVKENCYMGSFDLLDNFYSVPGAVNDQKYLKLSFERKLFKVFMLTQWSLMFQRSIQKKIETCFLSSQKIRA